VIADRYAANDIVLFEEIIRLSRLGNASVLATVIENAGSTPRKAGAKMLVRWDGSIMGSVGGGHVEQEVIAAALVAMQNGKAWTAEFKLTEQYGHVCGGSMLVYLEPNRVESRLVIIGAGHVGAALAALARFAGYHVTVVDERKEYACPERLPEANEIVAAPPPEALSRIDVNAATAIVIATSGFEQDFGAVRSALKTSAGYIALIGSKRKKEVLTETLAREGFGADEIARVIIPAGLAIKAETPQEIAVSIIAQLIWQRRGNEAQGIGNNTCGGCVTPDGNL
jgi:xanthine dehydrogenase accessory factor